MKKGRPRSIRRRRPVARGRSARSPKLRAAARMRAHTRRRKGR